MMRRASGSLGVRLSWWLAWATLAGLGAVCTAVYVVFAMGLSARQADVLAQKEALVRHAFDGASSDPDLSGLQHRLDDFLTAHSDLGLIVQAGVGPPLYRSIKIPASSPTRTSTFAVPIALADGRLARATLTLDTRADELLLRGLAVTLLGAAAVGALLVAAAGFLLVRYGLAPVRDLVEQTRQLASDTLGHPLDGSAQPDELQPLVEQFNALLRRLSMAYEQLEGFNADVAHELCTPLATLISATELALRKTRGADELREVLGSNLEDLQRLSGIVHDMLFLSYADHGAVARREAATSLAAIAAAVAEFHDAALEQARVGIRIVGDAAAEVDAALLRRALSNLIGNATRYATANSTIRVEIGSLSDARVEVMVVNRGPTVAGDQLPRLFDRFFRGDSVRAGAGAHHGLGLAIVAAIARMHGGEPIARSQDGTTSIGLLIPATMQPLCLPVSAGSAPRDSSHRAAPGSRAANSP